MKDSFILYNSFYEPIKSLSDEQLGRLFRSIFNYTIDGKTTQEEDIKIAFLFIKNQLDMDISKWEETRKKRSEAGKKHKGNQYSKLEQTEQVFQNGSDNENDNVNVNDNVIKENTKRKVFKKPTLEEVDQYCKKRNSCVDAKTFYEYFDTGGWVDSKGNKVKNWKQKIITWENNRKPIQEKEIPNWFEQEQNIKLMTTQEQEEIEGILDGIYNIS